MVAIENTYLTALRSRLIYIETPAESLCVPSVSPDELPVGYIAINGKSEIVSCNKLALDLFGVEKKEIMHEAIWSAFPELSSAFYRPILGAIQDGERQTITGYYSILNLWLEISVHPGQIGNSLYVRDVSKQHAIQLEKQLYLAVTENSADAVVITNKFGITQYVNKAAENLFAYSRDELIGENISLLMSPSERDSHNQYLQRYLKTGVSGILGVGGRDLVAYRKDGSTIDIELAISEFHSADEYYFVGNIRDITERKALESRLELMAGHDPLTGLPNRSLITDRANQSLSFASRNNLLIALLFIDLDGFKAINDTHGHQVGDQVLRALALRMNGAVRRSDTVSRLGGDEFVILLNNINHPDMAISVANKILEKLSLPIELEECTLTLSGSIGIACYPGGGEEFEVLLQHADEAMYEAKRAGRNGVKAWIPQ